MRVADTSPPVFRAAHALAHLRPAQLFRLPDMAGAAPVRAASLAKAESLAAQRRMEQRRRVARSGRGLLDALDQVKLALLAGDAAGALQFLSRQLDHAGERAGDPALDDILDHIRLRADVELAKARARQEAALRAPTG